MDRTIKWGIIGPGKIAHKFADGIRNAGGSELYAVASKDVERGNEFAKKFGATRVYSNYEELVKDPEVDIIYISTPHAFHKEQTLLCLRNKKPVLCEKPFSLRYDDVLEMVEAARANNTFLMEGMWSRFFPSMIKTLELVKQGVIGDIKVVNADFGFSSAPGPDSRLLNLKLGGGAQLDVGVYPLFFVLLMLGKPSTIQATSDHAETGADVTTAVQFRFKKGAMAQIISSIAVDTTRTAEVIGTLGSITLQPQWHKSQSVMLKLKSGETSSFDFPYDGFGFEYEIREVTKALRLGLKECELMSLDFSLTMAETADEILRQGNVSYSAI